MLFRSDPPATFSPQQKGLFSVLVNRPFDRNELAELVSSALHEITTMYDGKSGNGNTSRISIENGSAMKGLEQKAGNLSNDQGVDSL